MNIKDFLIDNYIWILAIILITIVTIIGFLADKKKGGKKNNNVSPTQQPIEPINNNQQPMQYQPELQNQMNNQQNMVSNNMNVMNNDSINQINNDNIMMNNQSMGTIPQPTMSDMQPQNIINTMNNPQSVENIVSNVENEPMYQPLSEQIPNIPPQPVPNYDVMQNQNMQEQSKIMNNSMPIGNNLNIGNNQFSNTQTMMNMPQPMQPIMSEQQIGQMPNYNTQTNMPENNNFAVPNIIPNQGTIPQPVNPISVPKPIMPQPIMTNQMMPEQQMGQVQPYNMTTPQQMPQTAQTPTQQPVNFVYGPQNNNQNM